MSDVMVFVRPTGGGWQVESEFAGAPLMFLSGAKAETAAHDLARRLMGGGASARVVVEDRMSQVVGAKRYAAPT
ncbi:MAG: hypothetical protein ACJ798_01040 [Phenylobacterium sp.]